MRREIVRSTSGGRILTGSGLHAVAGNADFGVGSQVFIFDGVALGQQRRQGRPAQPQPVTVYPSPLPAMGYHFADASALKMYYVDAEFAEVVRVDDITPPAIGAVLALHCYNEATEYLVWFVGSQCIIEQDGATVADFTSVFDSAPEKCDAYIDGSDLVWVSALSVYSDGDPSWQIAKHINGTVAESATYTSDNCAELAKTYIESQLSTAIENTAVSINNTETVTDVVTAAQARGGYWGVVYESNYTGSALLTEWGGLDADYWGEYVFDLWALDVYLSFSGSGIGAHGLTLNTLSRNWAGTATTGQTTIPAPVVGKNSRLIYSAKNESIVTEYSVPWEEVETIVETSIPRSVVTTSVYTGNSVFTGTANGGTASSFSVSIDVPAGVRFTDPVPCVVTFITGANTGISRTVTGSNLSNMVITALSFASPWPYSPLSADQFEIEVALGTGTTVTQGMEYTATCTQETITANQAVPTIVDVGNGYALQTALSEIDADGPNLYPVPKIKYSGATIYESDSIGTSHYASDGAWRTIAKASNEIITNELSGVAAWAGAGVVLAQMSEVDFVTPPFNPTSIVTKRFAGVNL